MKLCFLLIRAEGFYTPPFRALNKGIKPRMQIPYKNNIPRSFRAGLLIYFIYILFSGTPVSAQDNESEITFPPQLIFYAVYLGNIELLEQILETSPDIDLRCDLGGTALHMAVLQSNPEVIRLLLDHGYDKDAVSSFKGYTPLHYSVWLNNVDAVRMLVAYNADRNIRSSEGQTPQDMAAREGKREILLVLARR